MKLASRMLAGVLCALAAAAVATAAPGPQPRLQLRQLQPSACGPGSLVVSVEQSVRNDVDAGLRGNSWAYDDYSRTIQVWRLARGSYCAIARYRGSFTTIAGPSPGGTTVLPAGIRGRFSGGYRTTFTAVPRAHPAKPRHGSLGSFDYHCDTGGHCDAPYWASWYFAQIRGDKPDWYGWLYEAGPNGTWLNSSDGKQGDIVPKHAPHKG